MLLSTRSVVNLVDVGNRSECGHKKFRLRAHNYIIKPPINKSWLRACLYTYCMKPCKIKGYKCNIFRTVCKFAAVAPIACCICSKCALFAEQMDLAEQIKTETKMSVKTK